AKFTGPAPCCAHRDFIGTGDYPSGFLSRTRQACRPCLPHFLKGDLSRKTIRLGFNQKIPRAQEKLSDFAPDFLGLSPLLTSPTISQNLPACLSFVSHRWSFLRIARDNA